LRRKFCILQATASLKKAGTAREHWTSQIDDHLKPPTVAKRCTFRESRKSPALRSFVAGKWALATTSLYLSTKIERPQEAQNRAPGGVLPLRLNGLDGQDYRVMTVPDSHRPTHGPTSPKCPRQGHRLHPCPQTGTQSPHGRDRGRPPAQLSCAWATGCPGLGKSGCGLLPAKGVWRPLAASQVLCLSHPRVGKRGYGSVSITFIRISYRCGAHGCPAVAFSGGMSI